MNRYPSRIGVGASSILLIIVVLSLTLFGVLALVQARSDAELTERTALSADAFYDADARAQKVVAQIDDALAGGALPDAVEGVALESGGQYGFSIGSFDGHALNVSVDVSGGSCRITRYRYESTAEWTGETEGTLWQGD